METSESLGYLKGLIDGLDLDENSKEAKIFDAIVDVLENLTIDMEDMTEALEVVGEEIDAVDDDLSALEEFVYDDDCDCGCDCCDDDDDELVEFEVNCPTCNAEITVDEETVMEGKFECPNCGEILEFEFECDDDDCHCCD